MGKIEIIAIIVLVIVLLFVGGKKLPEFARGLGQSAKELKKGFRDGADDEETKPVAKKTTKSSKKS
jgi:sec-independent protein translocase protein TatA